MPYQSNFKIRLASHALEQGRLLAYPTEAVYGLGCDPLNASAVKNLLDTKQRPAHKGLILIASDYSQLLPFINPDPAMLTRIMPTWPGPVTWLIPAQAWVPFYLKGAHSTLAVRVSAHPTVQQLCTYYGGAIVSTSANISNLTPARTAFQVRKYFDSDAVFILPGATAQQDQPTAIYNAQDGSCLRQ